MTSAVKVVPAITDITDSNGVAIPHNGATKDTKVLVRGLSGPGNKVEVYDNMSLLLTISADNTGHWAGQLTKLQVGVHAIKAKSDKQESAIWSFSVIAPK